MQKAKTFIVKALTAAWAFMLVDMLAYVYKHTTVVTGDWPLAVVADPKTILVAAMCAISISCAALVFVANKRDRYPIGVGVALWIAYSAVAYVLNF